MPNFLFLLRIERNVPFACLSIFILSFALYFLIDVRLETYSTLEGSETLNIASSVADHGTFADAYGDSGPSAHAAPLYPLLLSLLFKSLHTQDEQGRVNIATFISTLLAALHYALLPLFAAAAGVRIRVGIVAGLFGALLPINHWMMTKGVFEYALSAFTVLAFCIVSLYCWTRYNFTGSWASFAGIVGGAVVLTYPPFLITMICLAFTGWCLVDRRERCKFLTFTLIQFSFVALALAPWVTRNQKTLGVPIWSRSNTGLELHLSNNDLSTASWSGAVMSAMHPRLVPAESKRVQLLGEIAYNQEKLHEATLWISSHKKRFAEMSIERFGLFWFPVLKRAPQTIATGFVTVLAFAGMVRLWRAGLIAARFLLVLWLASAIPLIPFQSSARLSLPIAWSFYFLAAFCILQFAKFDRGTIPAD